MPRLTDMLLRSLMSQEAPTPPGARLIVTVDGLPPAIHDRVTRGDLRGLSWRAWSADGRVAFMAAERITGGAPGILYAITIDGERESRKLWHDAGGGRWEPVDQTNEDQP